MDVHGFSRFVSFFQIYIYIYISFDHDFEKKVPPKTRDDFIAHVLCPAYIGEHQDAQGEGAIFCAAGSESEFFSVRILIEAQRKYHLVI